MQTNWNPDTSRPVIAGIPIAVPDQRTVDRVTSLYYIMIGSLATITQTAIKDLLDMLAQRKDLYKHQLKYRMKEAFSRSETLIGVFKKHTSTIAQYDLWLDITDSMEEDLKVDIQRLFYTTDNILLKHNVSEHKLQSQTVVAYNLSIMLHDLSQRYDEVMQNLGIGISYVKPSQMFLQPMYGMYTSMKEVAALLITDSDAEYFKEGGAIFKALEVIALKICDLGRIDNAADEGLKLNGVDYSGEEHQNNSFLPWNNVQISFLTRSYDKMTDEEMAKALGRSVGAVKAKMRQLKLKRK